MIEEIEKKMKILDLLMKTNDELVLRFFDNESDLLLDEKIDVLTSLSKGELPKDIPNYYEILELYPKDDQLWD